MRGAQARRCALDCANYGLNVHSKLAQGSGVQLDVLEIDNAVYQLVAAPARFDVIVSPNMFGDVLADCGALLLAHVACLTPAISIPMAAGIYQTGHGSAYDIAGKNIANPIGQMLSLAMMLENSLAWPEAAAAIRASIHDVLASNRRTRDIAQAGSTHIGHRSRWPWQYARRWSSICRHQRRCKACAACF